MSDYQPRISRIERVMDDVQHERNQQGLEDLVRTSGYAVYNPVPPASPAALTLPTDSNERKNYPMLSGCLKYFPAALAGVAKVSKAGNDKHNPGQPLHHARGKSTDHGDCIIRHLTDTEDLLAAYMREADGLNAAMKTSDQILLEASQLAWRALAYSQELHERFGSPLAPGAKE
jgi:hypothetical protein